MEEIKLREQSTPRIPRKRSCSEAGVTRSRANAVEQRRRKKRRSDLSNIPRKRDIDFEISMLLDWPFDKVKDTTEFFLFILMRMLTEHGYVALDKFGRLSVTTYLGKANTFDGNRPSRRLVAVPKYEVRLKKSRAFKRLLSGRYYSNSKAP